MDNTHRFTIDTGVEQTTVEGRKSAVKQAKEMSKRTWRPIQVRRTDSRVNMTFRGGWLQGYKYETRS